MVIDFVLRDKPERFSKPNLFVLAGCLLPPCWDFSFAAWICSRLCRAWKLPKLMTNRKEQVLVRWKENVSSQWVLRGPTFVVLEAVVCSAPWVRLCILPGMESTLSALMTHLLSAVLAVLVVQRRFVQQSRSWDWKREVQALAVPCLDLMRKRHYPWAPAEQFGCLAVRADAAPAHVDVQAELWRRTQRWCLLQELHTESMRDECVNTATAGYTLRVTVSYQMP